MPLRSPGALITALLVCSTLPAQAQILKLSADAAGTSCEIADPGPHGAVAVHVLLDFHSGASAVSFSAPVPEFSGLTFLYDDSPHAVVGTSQSEVSVAFGLCQPGKIVALTMYFARTSTGETCLLYPIQSGATYLDCAFNELPLPYTDGVALNSNGQCNPVPIHNPFPGDGATDTPLSLELSWDNGYYLCNTPVAAQSAAADAAFLYFGTDPDPPQVGSIGNPHAVGPLEPATTYYWKVASNEWPYLVSPIWSFTTTTNVAVETSTWGAIKALYR